MKVRDLNGWQRLWLVFSLILLFCAFYIPYYDADSAISYEIARYDDPNCKNVVAESGRFGKPQEGTICYNLYSYKMNPKNIDTREEYYKKAHSVFMGIAHEKIPNNLWCAFVVSALVYVMGFAVAWVRRGFNQKKVA